MNNFEETFFKKYIPEGQEVIEVFHRHWIKIIDDIILAIGLGALVPIFLYYNSYFLQENIEFYYLEIYLFLLYIIIIYKIFDWYNDVLILSVGGITRLEWSLFKTNMQTVDYEHIEGVEVDKNGILDTILRKGNLIIHKFGEEEVILDEAYKPYDIVNKIEDITSQIEHPNEMSKFDLMMDTLGGMVQNYLGKTEQKRENIFENDINNYYNNIDTNFKNKTKLTEELKKEFLNKIENTNGTIDLR